MAKKKNPITFSQIKTEFINKIKNISKQLDEIPDIACPNDEAVIVFTLHPEYTYSIQPLTFIKSVGLRIIGKILLTTINGFLTDVFIAGPRSKFRNLTSEIENWKENNKKATELIQIKNIRIQAPEERIKYVIDGKDGIIHLDEPIPSLVTSTHTNCTITLHAGDDPNTETLNSFKNYLALLGVDIDISRRFDVGGLSYLFTKIQNDKMIDIAKFPFLRTIKQTPKIRLAKLKEHITNN